MVGRIFSCNSCMITLTFFEGFTFGIGGLLVGSVLSYSAKMSWKVFRVLTSLSSGGSSDMLWVTVFRSGSVSSVLPLFVVMEVASILDLSRFWVWLVSSEISSFIIFFF